MIKLLIVDDSALMRRLLGDLFKSQDDFEVAFARDGVEALDCLETFRPDVVTLDVQMPRMDGLSCLDRLMVLHPCPVVMVSSLTDQGADATLEALQLGAVDFMLKPERGISLAMDALGPILIEKVRVASKARLRRAARLKERVRLRAKGGLAAGTVPKFTPPAGNPIKSAGPADGVVLIGSSTGGPPALDALLSSLPADFPWPIVVAQHMPASFTGPLARRLDKLCALTVLEVVAPTPLLAGHAYIGRGDADIIISSRLEGPVVTAAPASADYRWHPSVDRLVLTAMEHLGPRRLIGVLVTGMGSDGAAAMTRLSQEGGRTIAESEETAIIWGMPGELVKAGGAQVVAPLGKIALTLMQWVP